MCKKVVSLASREYGSETPPVSQDSTNEAVQGTSKKRPPPFLKELQHRGRMFFHLLLCAVDRNTGHRSSWYSS